VLRAAGDDAGAQVVDLLRGEDASARQVAIGQIESLSAGALKTVGARLDQLPVPSQVMALTAMAARGDKALVEVAARASASDNDAVARAGLQALGTLGDASAVPLLLGKAAAKSPHSAVALDSLARIGGEEVNRQLIAALDREKTPAQAARIIDVLGRRKALSAIPALLQNAQHPDASVRAAAFASLGAVAEPKDAPPMIAALLKLDRKERDPAAAAIANVCSREADPEKRADPVLAAYRSDKSLRPEDAAALLLLLGRLGGTKALEEVKAALSSDAAPVRDAAHTALFNWPDDAAAAILLKVAEESKATAQGRSALRSLARVCAVQGGAVPVPAKLEMLKKAMACADRDDERRAILDQIGFVRHLDTLHYVVPFLDNPALAQSACRAVVELAHSKMLREPNRLEFQRALDRVIALAKDKQLVERAKDYKQQP